MSCHLDFRPLSKMFIVVFFSFIGSLAFSKEPAVLTDGNEVPLYKGSYALVIGVSSYINWPSLPNVARESSDVSAALSRQGFRVRYIIDPTGEVLQKAFRDFFADFAGDSDNRLIIYFAGHGHSIGENGYLVPVDAPDPNSSISDFLKKSQSMTALVSASREYKARHALYIFDSCFSGAIFSTRASANYSKPDGNDLTRYLLGPAAFPVRQFITAGSETQRVPEVSQFTPLFLRAIEGHVDDLNKNGFVSAKELGLWLSRQLTRYSSNQTPRSGTVLDPRFDRGDFVFSVPIANKLGRKSVAEQSRSPNDSSMRSIEGVPDRTGKRGDCFLFNNEITCE